MFNKNIQFSVIMPTFNRKHCIKNAIDSALAQTYQNFELIIIDDGSTDNTNKFLQENYKKEIEEGKINYIELPENKGASFARNEGLKNAKGNWIAYLDSDNKMVNFFLENFVDGINKFPDTDLFYAKIKHVNSGKIIGQKFDFDRLVMGNFIDLGVFVHSKNTYIELGGFDEKLKRLIDWDLIIRYTEKKEPRFLDKVLLDYYDGKDFARITLDEDGNRNFKKVVMDYYSRIPEDEFAAIYRKHYIEKMKLKDEFMISKKEIDQKEQEIKMIQDEITLMKSSKFWKLRNLYIKCTFALFHPVKFVKKYYKKAYSILFITEAYTKKVTDVFLLNFKNKRKTITAFVPFDFLPNNFGGGVRMMSVYKALSRNFNINLVGITGEGEYVKRVKINNFFNVYIVPRTKEYQCLLEKEESLVGGYLHDILLTKKYELIPNLVKISRTLSVNSDYLISSHPYFFEMLEKYGNSKEIIYEAHNVDYELKKTYFDWKSNKYARNYLDLVEEIEELACKKSSLVITVSEEDQDKLFNIYNIDKKKVVLVPNGISVEKIEFYPMKNRLELIDKNRKNFIFVGSAHGPNIEAVDFIIKVIALKNKEANFVIVGNVADSFKNVETPDNVIFTGIVSDAEKKSLYNHSYMAINPMFSGSGSNLKIPEYAAAGIPIVSTNFGMRGFGKLNEFVYLADKDEFANVISSCMNLEFDELDKKTKKARRVCEVSYSENSIIKDLIKRLK